MTEPTDDDLDDLMHAAIPISAHFLPVQKQKALDFARAVLAKWGTPAPVGVEPAQWQKRHQLRTNGEWENTNEHDAKWWRDNSQGWEIRALYTTPQPTQPQAGAVPLTDEQIDAVAENMPGGLAGFLKGWGWRQFAREILTLRRMPDWEPQFDCMTPKQEELALQCCQEIAGPRGKRGSPPDPVRLLEMAEALYKAEREHHHGIKGGQHGTDET